MRRIRRDQNHEEFLDELKSGDNPLFKDLWKVLIFAAMLGYRAQRRTPLAKYDSGKAIPDTYFGNSPSWPGILYLLGLVETNSTDVLGSKPENEDELIEIFEEYANGGLHIMRERLAHGQDKFKSLLDLLDEFGERGEAPAPDLTGVTI